MVKGYLSSTQSKAVSCVEDLPIRGPFEESGLHDLFTSLPLFLLFYFHGMGSSDHHMTISMIVLSFS